MRRGGVGYPTPPHPTCETMPPSHPATHPTPAQVIAQYVLDRWASSGPSLRAATPELRAKAALATRVHDLYITTIQVGRGEGMGWACRVAGLRTPTIPPHHTTTPPHHHTTTPPHHHTTTPPHHHTTTPPPTPYHRTPALPPNPPNPTQPPHPHPHPPRPACTAPWSPLTVPGASPRSRFSSTCWRTFARAPSSLGMLSPAPTARCSPLSCSCGRWGGGGCV
jgi:hypothetical protein